MEKEDKITRLIIGVLAVALVVVTILWINSSRDMQDVLGQLESKTVDYKAEIEEKCGGLTSAQVQASEECQAVLKDFAEMLEQYDRAIAEEIQEDAASTSTPR